MNTKTKKTYYILVAFTIFMFSFSYMLVPLYDLFCDITGLNGKTNKVKAIVIEEPSERFIKIKFVSNVAQSAPVKFYPIEKEMTVQIGKIYNTKYLITNTSKTNMITTASPSVVPGEMSQYFRKIECFCFNHQEIKSNETKELGVQFMIDTEIPNDADSLILSYTMFDITEKNINKKVSLK
ncbi:MAG: cytochrome c oxidase assembly protein [Gammaproteobacteria bacterium]|nr:cytochrome c oxidase assembly protein [Gammaproteobacteria bacterium]|tara:strand:+ start:107371 stop:107913 length:543 start_codon:yes stop_codon:yes gene_type:complete